jgi:hypothetical protein
MELTWSEDGKRFTSIVTDTARIRVTPVIALSGAGRIIGTGTIHEDAAQASVMIYLHSAIRGHAIESGIEPKT